MEAVMSDSALDLPEYWPRLGERLFVPGSPGRDADVASGLDERMYWMKEAFKEAADLLSTQAEITMKRTSLFGRSYSVTDSI